jgi:protein-disulfide isomerase
VRLVRRDYPLPPHRYAKLAARFANAAGRLGYYDTAVAEIFRTQSVWQQDGSLDAQLQRVLPAGVMERVRQMAHSDRSLDETVTRDLQMGAADQIRQAPSIIVAADGKRQEIAPIPDYARLKSYLDRLLE